MLVDVSVGHGMMPNGKVDPGAVSPVGIREYDLNRVVVTNAVAALRRSGLMNIFTESDAGNSLDPDYRGSTARVNAENAGLAIEIHFDSVEAPVGGFGIYANERSRGKMLAIKIRERWAMAGLPQRDNYADRKGLYFLQHTNCPALIWECDHVGSHEAGILHQMGEAIAAGMCDYLGLSYVREERFPVPPKPVNNPSYAVNAVDGIAAASCGYPGSEGIYILGLDGGITNFRCPFWGSFPGLPPQLGIHKFGRIRPREGFKIGYVITDTNENDYEFGPGLNGF